MRRYALQFLGVRQMMLQGILFYKCSLGEDNAIYKWNVNTNDSSKWMDLDSYAGDHDWIPLVKGVSDLVAIGFTDGSFKLYNKNGKL